MTCAAGTTREALDRLLRIAYDAADAALTFYGHEGAVTLKQDQSPVTEADRAAHAVIARELERWDPSVPIISEEADVPPYEERQQWRRFWLVDPLDGTKEFIARNGEFTVNIALIENAQPVLGVIVAPALAVAYSGGNGLGAWRHEGDGSAVPLPLDEESPGYVRIVESRSHPSPRLESFIASLGVVERITLGSSLKFCRVAEGSADAYARFGRTMEWDVAAGDCIVRNARPGHGVVCPRYNQPTLSVPGFVVGAPAVCARAMAIGV